MDDPTDPTRAPAPPPWTVEEETPLGDFRIFSLDRVRSRSALRPGHASDFIVLRAPDWVNVVALTDADEVVLVEQYRHGTRSLTLEIPGGMVDPGESFLEAGLRELLEETGFGGGTAEVIGVVEPNPAFQTNRCGTVLVRGVTRMGAQDLDPNEEISVRLEPLAAIPELIRGGAISHALVVVAFHHLSLAP